MTGPRLPAPGPSYIREQELAIGDRHFSVGMSRPSTAPDDWWLAILWVAGDDGLASFLDVAPAVGPPPDPPLARLGPILAGSLSGLIREEDGRLAIRVGPVAPPDDPERPWRMPLAVRLGIGLEPARAATLRPNALALEVLTAFRRSVEGLFRR